MNENIQKTERRFLTRKELLERIPYSIVHIYRLIKLGKFPRPVVFGANRVAWETKKIDSWIAEKMRNREAGND